MPNPTEKQGVIPVLAMSIMELDNAVQLRIATSESGLNTEEQPAAQKANIRMAAMGYGEGDQSGHSKDSL